jgi:propanol-preferring alcohol dehydrogenase
MENCDRPLFTGYTRTAASPLHTIADVRFAFSFGDGDDALVAPLTDRRLIAQRLEQARHVDEPVA